MRHENQSIGKSSLPSDSGRWLKEWKKANFRVRCEDASRQKETRLGTEISVFGINRWNSAQIRLRGSASFFHRLFILAVQLFRSIWSLLSSKWKWSPKQAVNQLVNFQLALAYWLLSFLFWLGNWSSSNPATATIRDVLHLPLLCGSKSLSFHLTHLLILILAWTALLVSSRNLRSCLARMRLSRWLPPLYERLVNAFLPMSWVYIFLVSRMGLISLPPGRTSESTSHS